ncbi:MAG: InlB B-repeat-containing protein, partial [Chitinivibrionales bacterium]
VFNPQIVVKNTAGLSDTLTITLTLHAPGAIDTLPPMMKILSPSTDSSSVSSSSYPVKILCKDPSGVASVKCFIGAAAMPVTAADSTYTASVSGLKAGVLTTLAFIAVDSSARANKDTLFVHIKYDSTMADNVPPSITILTPSKDTIIGNDSVVMRVKCIDASGIASVVCSLKTNQAFVATKSTPGDSIFTATVKGLTAGVFSTITVVATDSSTARNTAAATVKIKYDNDKTAPALRLFSPAKDSTSVAGSATTIQVVCTDPSGIASLACNAGTTSYPVTKSTTADSIWSSNITGLVKGQFTTLTIVATDSSLAANKATLTVHVKYDSTVINNPKPTITLDPADQTVLAGQPDSFSVAATGAGTLAYQWRKNGTDITGETKAILKIAAVAITDTGSYTCVVSNDGGKDTSKAARMTVQFSVIYDGNGKTGGTVPAGANYNFGATVTVAGNTGTLVRTGYTFAGWNAKSDGSGTSYAAAATFAMGPANVTLYAKWTQNVTFALTVTATNGSVTKVPDLTAYDSGTVVTLTPVPSTGYHFTGWSGGLTGTTNPGSIIMTAAKSVTATFALNAPNSFALTVLATNGTVTKSPDAAQYDSGTVVSLTAVPATGYQFTGWSGGLTGTTNPGPITMTSAMAVTATFTLKTYQLSFIEGTGGSITAPASSPTPVNHGVATTITAVAGTGYDFVNWTVTSGTATIATPTALSTTVTLTAGNATVTANFALKTYQLTISAGTGGSITSPASPATVTHGVATTITAAANAGYNFVNWTVTNGTATIATPTALSTTVTLTSGNVTVTANFSIMHFTVTFNSQGGSAVAPQTVNYNATATAPTPPTLSCNTFAGWYREAAGLNSWNFSTNVIIRDTTIYAKWTLNGNPSVSVTPSTPICAGSNAVFSATPSSGTAPYSYQWYQASGGGVVGTSSSLSIATTSQTGGATQSYPLTYYCIVTDACTKTAQSSNATVTVNYLPDAPIVEFETDIDATQWLHCGIMQSNPSTYFCCWYRYNKNNSGFTPWSKTDGTNTCDGLSSTLGGATPANTVQVQAYIVNTLTNCQSATDTENWPQ